ncbi:MAG: GNAT family N-acetyltransferase, partial [Candidatus Heimdallarchaeota archaeon]|nr:GNAT family N-acetyltransferase [Candidatus Heimdallarchaeota archaeon]
MDYIIRKLELEDIPQIMEIYEKITDTKSPDTDELEARMDFGESLLCLGAEIDNTLIGFIFGNIRRGEFGEEKPVGWIGLIGVDPKFQNEKIGRKLGIEL